MKNILMWELVDSLLPWEYQGQSFKPNSAIFFSWGLITSAQLDPSPLPSMAKLARGAVLGQETEIIQKWSGLICALMRFPR